MKPLIIVLLLGTSLLAQLPWTYNPGMDIRFPLADSLVAPYLCAVDNKDNLWVISSSTSAPGVVNALYKAEPGDTMFTLVDDYRGNANVESARGITVIDDTVFVICRKPDQATAMMIEYPDGAPEARIEYTTGGYGTWVMGLSANKDKYIYAGISYYTSIRVYDFTDGSANRSKWVPLETYPSEPGGHFGAELTSKIRDVAVLPDGDYSLPETPFYTSRESDTLGQKGGIAVWSGGTQTVPQGYTGDRVTDVASDLSWLWWTPYGIYVDRSGALYACGTDTTRSWVKSYDVFGNFAVEKEELPGLNSSSNPDPEGAPMISPTDVVLSNDENWAYIVDMEAKRAFVFSRGTVGLDKSMEQPVRAFRLDANYPNPFNSQTAIGYWLPADCEVELDIYNIMGQRVYTFMQGIQQPGYHTVKWNADGFGSGIYYYKLTVEGQQPGASSRTRKMLLVK